MTQHIRKLLLPAPLLAVAALAACAPILAVDRVTADSDAESLAAEATVQTYLASLAEWDLGTNTDDLLAAVTTDEREAFDRERLREGGVAGRGQTLRAAELGDAVSTGSGLEISGCIEIRDQLGLAASADATWTLVADEASPTGWAVESLLTFESTTTCIRTVS